MGLNYLTIQQALEGLKKKEFSSVELVSACLEQIRKHDKKINAFITVREEEAIKEAKKADKIRKAHKSNELRRIKQMLGMPIAVKDLYVTQNIRTTAGSKVLQNYIPQYSGTVVKKLKEAGAIIIGKANEDAWAHGASGENSDFGPTKNPYDNTRVAGGSSSGPAAAVAAGMCLASFGTDTGGSIRNPASFCGIVGLKPTYGRVSRFGIIAMASSLDSIGHFARTVSDCEEIFKITAGKDAFDATTSEINAKKYAKKRESGRYKIGIPKEYFAKDINIEVKQAVRKAIKALEANGSKIEKVSLPHTKYGVSAYYIIMSSETSSNLARYNGIRYGKGRSKFGQEAKRRIMLGTYALSAGYYEAYYKKAMQVRTLIKKDFANAFSKVDILIAPVVPSTAFKIGEKQRPLDMYLADILTIPSSLAGIPSLSVPCGFSKNGLPIGMQIIGPQFSEELLFNIGYKYQQLTNWHKRRPKIEL
jgi:aspartyl-tRNA(Asn)/glutamyl-tRNA(Gln) amidotransferase subunit A